MQVLNKEEIFKITNKIYNDNLGVAYATDGYYSDGIISRLWISPTLNSPTSC